MSSNIYNSMCFLGEPNTPTMCMLTQQKIHSFPQQSRQFNYTIVQKNLCPITSIARQIEVVPSMMIGTRPVITPKKNSKKQKEDGSIC